MRYLPGEVLRDRFPWSLSLESEEFLLLVAPDDPPASSTRFRFLLFSNVGGDFLPPVDDTLFFKSLYSSSSLASSSPFIHSRIFFWNKTTEITNKATQLDSHYFHSTPVLTKTWAKPLFMVVDPILPEPYIIVFIGLTEVLFKKTSFNHQKMSFLNFSALAVQYKAQPSQTREN